MDDSDQTQKIVEEAKGLLAREQAKRLVDDGKAMMEKDLRGGLAKLRQALAIDPDYPDLEDEIFLREDAVEKLDNLLDFVVVLLKERKDYQACQMLKELPENYIIEDKQQLIGDLTSRIDRAEVLMQQVKELPKSGGNQALEFYQEAEKLIPDYPGLQEELATARSSMGRYNVYLESIGESIRNQNFAKAEELLGTFREVYQDDPNVGKFEVALRNKKKELRLKQNLKKTILAMVGLASLVLLLSGGYFGYELMTIRSADSAWENVSRLLEEKKFAEAQTGCQEIVAILEKVRVFSRAHKAELLAKVNQVLRSEMVQQGAAGRVMVDGVYIPAQDLPKVMSAKGLIDEARNLSEVGKNSEAIAKYDEALRLASSLAGDLAGPFEVEIRGGILAARERMVKALVAETLRLNKSSDFENALARINEASVLVSKYDLHNSGLAEEITQTYNEIKLAKFRAMVAVGDRHLGSGRYDEALGAYDRALGFAQVNKLKDGQDSVLSRVKESMVVARVNGQVEKGDNSFRRSRWREAIIDYSTAIKLHRESSLNNELPSYNRALTNLAKAKKAAALEELHQGEREAQKYFAAGEWQKAKPVYARLLTLVDQGGYGQDQDFARVRTLAESRLAEVDERLLIDDKRDYLMKRHRALLRKVFNLNGTVAFLDPEVVFLVEDDKGMKFSISARSYEKKGTQGKYTFYEVIYAFNRKNQDWSLIDQKMGSQVTGGR